MNGRQFYKFLKQNLHLGDVLYIASTTGREYTFSKWLNNGSLQFTAAQKKSIPREILISVKNDLNANQEINTKYLKERYDYAPGGCSILVIKKLLRTYQ